MAKKPNKLSEVFSVTVKKPAKSPGLESLAKEMYLLLIKCGMYLDGDESNDPEELRNDVAGIVRDMDSYYVRKAKGE